MKAIHITAFGRPWDVASLTDAAARDPGPGEAAIAVEASPVNPSDMLMMRGHYGVRPVLPAIVGTEGVGRVTAVGAGVDHIKPGDRVLVPYETPAWAEQVVGSAAWLFPLPEEADPQQLAMLGINPATAYLLLKEFVNLKPGDWVVQNAANSGVGRSVIAIARAWGLKTVNIVRREEVVRDLQSLGADVVLLDGPDLASRIAAATGKAKIRLGFDAVGGEATQMMLSSLAANATVVSYAALSAQPVIGPPQNIIFREQQIRGFWLVPWFRRTAPERIAAMYRELLPLVTSGAIRVPVEAVYTFEAHAEALQHAGRAKGKILFMPAKAG